MKYNKNFISVTPPIKRIVLLLTGSFNPVTIAHLRMLELARDYYHHRSIQVLEGIISPVSDSYGKPGLAKVNYRIEMLQASVPKNNWVRVDTWEAEQTTWTRTKLVLDHHHEIIKQKYGPDTELRYLSGSIEFN
jgi:nicotinamide mononucleotide adenylyltransferase